VSRWLQLVGSQERSVYIGSGGRVLGEWASGNSSGGEGGFRRGRVNSETRSDRARGRNGKGIQATWRSVTRRQRDTKVRKDRLTGRVH
jgi:hypothetical protein